MAEDVLAILSRITTVSGMTQAFRDKDRCRRLVEAMVWPRGRICPACGYKRSTSIPGRDWGKTKRPGLYQCSNGSCHHQFTVTTRTPPHSTKLPLWVWLQGLWLILQSDKGLSSVRLGEALGISQQAAWRMGHALRLLMTNEKPLEGIVEIDELRIGGRLHKPGGELGPGPGRGRRGQPKTTRSAIDGRTTRPAGYAISQRIRKRIEEGFGGVKTCGGLGKTRRQGTERVGWSFSPAAAACNLIRLPKLIEIKG
jgi:hypothetical protein